MKKSHLVWKASLFGVVPALGASLWLTEASASDAVRYAHSTSGIVGITSDQVARLTAANVSDQTEIAKLTFVDAAGTVFKQLSVTLQPGEAGFLDAAVADDTPAGAVVVVSRLELRGVVDTLPAVQSGAFPPDPCVSTLEVMGADGHTTLIDGFFRVNRLNPQPLPP